MFLRRRPPALGLLVIGLTALVSAARAESPIKIETIQRQSPAQHYVVARVDLTSPRLSVAIAPGGPDPDGPGPWETVLAPTSAIAKTADLDLAVNTVFFSHKPAVDKPAKYAAGEAAASLNRIIIDGKPATTNTSGALLSFDKSNRATIGAVRGPAEGEIRQAVAGSMQIVTAGRNTGGDNAARHPRTAAGVADDGRTLVLFVADGRRKNWATGLTLAELADEMIKLGCRDAINLDGGGSTTMVRKTPDGHFKVLNTPSDGSTFIVPLSVERPVPYVLGVRVKPE